VGNLLIVSALTYVALLGKSWLVWALQAWTFVQLGFLLSPFGLDYGWTYSLLSLPFGLLEGAAYLLASSNAYKLIVGEQPGVRRLVYPVVLVILGGLLEAIVVRVFWYSTPT